jgi:hypothetical protein
MLNFSRGMERLAMIRMRLRISRVSMVAALVGLLVSLGAVPASGDDTERAKTAFAEGRTLFEGGDFSRAASAFRSAYALAPHWKVLYNIGQCEAAARRYGLALDVFEQYLAEGGDEIDAERRDEVLAEVDRLRRMVGGIDIEAPAGSVVLVDGEERGRTPLSGRLRLAAGVEHLVVIMRGDDLLLSRKVRIGSGEVMSLVTKAAADGPVASSPEPREPSAPSAPADSSTDRSPRPPLTDDASSGKLPVLFWVGAGATVVAVGLGAGFWGAAGSRADDFSGLNGQVASGEIPPDDKKLLEARDDVERYDNVSLGMWIGAGVLAAATATVLIVHLAGDGDEAPGAGATLTPAPGGFAVRF